MSFFRSLGKTAGSFAGTKKVQTGSDFLINKHTSLNVFRVDAGLRRHADELLKEYFLNHGGGRDLNEYEAALLKLTVFYAASEQASDEVMMGLVGDAITEIRAVSGEQIGAGISLEVLSQTGR